MPDTDFDVLVVGAGPCGLMLANELGRRNIRVLVVDRAKTVAIAPQANATQARTMEHFRRLGFAAEIRKLGLPSDYPTDVAYFTTYSEYELGRFEMPPSGDAERLAKENAHFWNAAELPHRIAQSIVEEVLFKNAKACSSVEIQFETELVSFDDQEQQVLAQLKGLKTGANKFVSSKFIFAADGPQSTVRKALGIRYEGGDAADRDFMGGEMLSIYVDCPAFYEEIDARKAWMYWTFNPRRRALLAAVDGVGTFTLATQLRSGESQEAMTVEDAGRMFVEALGKQIPFAVTGFDTWVSGRALVVPSFSKGRAFLGGDAAHLFTPTGGMGYNTAVDDAVNIGWKLAAVIKGQAGSSLLDSYEVERKPIALRNTKFAGQFADSVGLYAPTPAIEADSDAGRFARARAGAYLAEHGRNEFTIPGISLGARYDGSPVIVDDGTRPPPDQPCVYVPSAKPGGRAPHFWMDDGSSLYDHFGFEWTLLLTAPPIRGVAASKDVSSQLGLDLKILDMSANDFAADLYQCQATLIRPDQIIVWRGDIPSKEEIAQLFDVVLGRRAT